MAKTKFQQNELTKRWIESYRHLTITKGLSQMQLQKDIGINQSFISQILNNRVNFPPKYLDKYCKAYRINMNSLNPKGQFNLSGDFSIASLAALNSNKKNSSVDKALESIKNALYQSNGKSYDTSSVIRILNNIATKLVSLQNDLDDLERTLHINTNVAKRRSARK